MRVTGLDIDHDDLVGRDGGFLAIRRLRLRNRRADGSQSREYLCDFAVRPYGLDAVVVVLWRRRADRVEVLVRDCLRPAIAMGREPSRQTIPDAHPYLQLRELVAGILEIGDRGEPGIRFRAAEEAHEEAGYRVDPSQVTLLGAASFPSPGSLPEKFHFTAIELAADAVPDPPAGDGSPMEEGSSAHWLELHDAIAACVRGDLEDLKTEIGLRRLAERLR